MSVVVTAEFSNGQVTAARFRPVVLSLATTGDAPGGTPYLAEAAEAEIILQRLVGQSRRHGTVPRVDTAGQAAVLEIPRPH